MLFVDDDECLKTPPVCDIDANCKNTLSSFVLVKRVLTVTVKHVKVKFFKKNMKPYGKHHMLLIGAKLL